MAIDPKRYDECVNFIKDNNNYLIVTHVNPDGDTIGGALAMAHMLEGLHKKFQIVNEDRIPNKYLFLPMADEIRMPAELEETIDVVITVDCADYKRIGTSLISRLSQLSIPIINIDHHPTNDEYGSINIIDEDAASTTYVIYNMCKMTGIDITYNMAINLYTGLMTDTGSFKYSNTSADVHRVASELIDIGIDVYEVAEKVFETNTLDNLLVLKNSLATLTVDETGKIASIEIVTDEISQSQVLESEGLVNYPRSIEGVEVAVSFKKIEQDKVKVGLRSKKYVDVSVIAQIFNGGGHKRASGCTIMDSIENVKKTVFNEIKKYV
ncbi:DHH family phosphoesterase [Desulfuribacillus alkaliarsenatis]|uniref:Exopolyphosphatase n=1 Tax=Desulfuribacillus alkaliarsenatis TaxID=766136 RepID=A0A1E5G628_9FIRM|nr:bifunctional oligoribonuclease/PAP phosphatase NrnA [Desulfuribacillus alkaliarsenatis]OEF98648.1 hypothetical protein BHF68_03010 [Desulfuribacillus alkaliarsenatis]